MSRKVLSKPKKYRLLLRFKGKGVGGGIPRNPKIMQVWIRIHRQSMSPERKQSLQQQMKEFEEEVETMHTTFAKDEKGIFIEDHNIKGFMKDVIRMLMERMPLRLLHAINHGVFIPEKNYFYRDEKCTLHAKQVDETIEHPVLLYYATGLRRMDILKPPLYLPLEITVMSPLIDSQLIRAVFESGQYVGLGAQHARGYGKYELLEFEEIR